MDGLILQRISLQCLTIIFNTLMSPGTTDTINYGFEVYIQGMTSTAISFSYDDGGGHQITTMTLMEVSA